MATLGNWRVSTPPFVRAGCPRSTTGRAGDLVLNVDMILNDNSTLTPSR